MGMRLYIKNEFSGRTFYARHKFYGYVDYKECKNSFDFLYPFLSYQDEIFNYDGFGDEAQKESYGLLCALPSTRDIKMDAESFVIFMKKYISDLKKSYRSLGAINDAVLMLEQANSEPGFKILSWE